MKTTMRARWPFVAALAATLLGSAGLSVMAQTNEGNGTPVGAFARFRRQASTTTPPAGWMNISVRDSDGAVLATNSSGVSVSLGGGAGTGTVTSVDCTTGLTCTPDPIIATGTIALTNTSVTPGSYSSANITIDAQGRITAAANGSGASLGNYSFSGDAMDLTGAATMSIAPTTATAIALGKPTTETTTAIGTAQTSGFTVKNTTAAAAFAQQYSPMITLEGQGWKTNATAASQSVDWSLQAIPIQGAANPTGGLEFFETINGGSPSGKMLLQDFGGVISLGLAGNSVQFGSNLLGGSAAGMITSSTTATLYANGTNIVVADSSFPSFYPSTNRTTYLGKSNQLWQYLWLGQLNADTTTNTINLLNESNASAGTQEPPGAIYFKGQGWKTDATASAMITEGRIQFVPVQGTAAPTAEWDFTTQINSAGYKQPLSVSSTGLLTETFPAVGTSQSAGLILQNTTAAAAGAQQYSPMLELSGRGWKTNATAASQTVTFGAQTRPVQAAANPTGFLDIAANINGAGYGAPIASFNSAGYTDFGSFITTPVGGAGGVFNTAQTAGIEISASGSAVAVYGSSIGPLNDLAGSDGNASFRWTAVYTRHIETGQSAVPSCSGGAALGTGGSPGCVCVGTDTAMECTFTTGTSGQTTGTMGTITFNTAFDATPRCTLTMSSGASQSGLGWATAVKRGSSSATQIVVEAGAVPGGGGSIYPTQIICVD